MRIVVNLLIGMTVGVALALCILYLLSMMGIVDQNVFDVRGMKPETRQIQTEQTQPVSN